MTMTDLPGSDVWAPPTAADAPGAAAARPSNRLPKTLGILAVLGVAVGAFTVASLALFTDSASVDSNTFSTGTVDISTSPATQAFNPGPMAPGDQVVAEITVTNGGTLDLRYAMDSVTTEDALAAELDLTVRVGVASCTVANWDLTGTEISPVGTLGATGGRQLFGDPAPGSQAGDRPLAVGASEVLCLHVELPVAAGDVSQGLTTTATFGFDAEQTDNN